MILAVLTVLTLSDPPIITARADTGHVAAPAAAGEAETQPAPSADAGRAMTTEEQIAAWISRGAAADAGDGSGAMLHDTPMPPERRIRGEVAAAVGSHGYRAFDLRMDAPLGETGFLSLHYGRSEGGRLHRYDPYPPYSFDARPFGPADPMTVPLSLRHESPRPPVTGRGPWQ